jgi:hypothetical protein
VDKLHVADVSDWPLSRPALLQMFVPVMESKRMGSLHEAWTIEIRMHYILIAIVWIVSTMKRTSNGGTFSGAGAEAPPCGSVEARHLTCLLSSLCFEIARSDR